MNISAIDSIKLARDQVSVEILGLEAELTKHRTVLEQLVSSLALLSGLGSAPKASTKKVIEPKPAATREHKKPTSKPLAVKPVAPALPAIPQVAAKAVPAPKPLYLPKPIEVTPNEAVDITPLSAPMMKVWWAVHHAYRDGLPCIDAEQVRKACDLNNLAFPLIIRALSDKNLVRQYAGDLYLIKLHMDAGSRPAARKPGVSQYHQEPSVPPQAGYGLTEAPPNMNRRCATCNDIFVVNHLETTSCNNCTNGGRREPDPTYFSSSGSSLGN